MIEFPDIHLDQHPPAMSVGKNITRNRRTGFSHVRMQAFRLFNHFPVPVVFVCPGDAFLVL